MKLVEDNYLWTTKKVEKSVQSFRVRVGKYDNPEQGTPEQGTSHATQGHRNCCYRLTQLFSLDIHQNQRKRNGLRSEPVRVFPIQLRVFAI